MLRFGLGARRTGGEVSDEHAAVSLCRYRVPMSVPTYLKLISKYEQRHDSRPRKGPGKCRLRAFSSSRLRMVISETSSVSEVGLESRPGVEGRSLRWILHPSGSRQASERRERSSSRSWLAKRSRAVVDCSSYLEP